MTSSIYGPSSSASYRPFPSTRHNWHSQFCFICYIFFSLSFLRMSQGRGSAVATLMVMSLLVLLYCEVAEAATYTVGDAGGWTFNVVGWPKGKRFRAGDILQFNYNPSFHNVVGVGKVGYSTCKTLRGAKVYQTGNERIRLVKGQNFFICNFPGHCESGMKIAVTAV
ncbi:hypothetical protein RJ639_021716 [Escallonia herrerae]|uniref:Basic blue protein n=1 Tax=Escallonia herrerae TaxID=1293975 RepID=A0AA88V5D2_9ASTE|nr:hypothetical protein RJ639_021716 [Escallonia herrerae]